MTTALPPKGAYSTPPNGHYSPEPVHKKENPAHSLQPIPGHTLTKTIKVFLDANLPESPETPKKINGQVEKIPSVNELVKGIIEKRESLLNETSPENSRDIEALFSSLTKLKDTSSASSLVNFELLIPFTPLLIKWED